MRIGIDFDNTIADYRHVFADVACKLELLAPAFIGDKTAVRQALRDLPDGEQAWQRLQGQVYGKFMPLAQMMPGVSEFLQCCRARKVRTYIISHKTLYGHFDPEQYNLRTQAMAWMTDKGIFDTARFALNAKDVIFAETRSDKVARIAEIAPDHFVDDLAEVFNEPAFPPGTHRHLFNPAPDQQDGTADWFKIRETIFGA